MKTGKIHYFKDHGNSCVITDPRPPRYWYNYLWSEQGYCTQVSQIGHGRSYYINTKADMCMINNQDAKYIYLRDDDTNTYWNIGEGPLNEAIDDFTCEHSIGYSVVQSQKNGIHASWKLFVPHQGYNEVWVVKVKNSTNRVKNISLFSAVSFELEGFKYPRYYEMYRSCETIFDSDLNGVYCQSKHPFAPHARYNGYISCSETVHAYDGDLGEFLGPLGSFTKLDSIPAPLFQRPDVVIKGRDCTNSTTTLSNLGGVLQNKLSLAPGEEKELYFVMGVSETLKEAVQTADKYFDKNRLAKSLLETQAHYKSKYKSLSVNTPDDKLNIIMNEWVKKQIDFCIVGKKGVRDNLQIAVALLNYRQDRAKEEIIECLRHQFKEGHAVLTWFPYDDTRYSDQPFWIIWAVIELIKETGDYSLLDLEIEYQDGGSGTILEHMKAAVNRLIEDKGTNGLVRIMFADWNDALNITTDPEAESVMLSEQFCYGLRELSQLMQIVGDSDYASYLTEQYDLLRRAINESAWDGNWYMRALSKIENIGSKDSEGSKIYINAQSWAILADIPNEEKLPKVLESIDSMEHEFGFPINMPPYPEYSPNVGRMSGMLPGLFENGGVYCHATGFKIIADCKVGRGESAIRTLKKIIPDSEANPSTRSGAEPYVFTNCYSIHPKFYGKSYQSWTTGTSAWGLMSLYEGILGIKRDYAGLRIDPCFPPEWDSAEVYREFRGNQYQISINNPSHLSKGNVEIHVDGRLISGNILPLFDDGLLHQVEITLIP
ncbi:MULTISPECIES: GH36-type glycosyl hydrolase domain-containing protein [unclassified Paenibacillus]|uniref:GH36-type glycosyl hydrolase domain-containing protein n=1 Tax=unclassified Paenibacillus TaxID=185978 RepID=UPI0038387F65